MILVTEWMVQRVLEESGEEEDAPPEACEKRMLFWESVMCRMAPGMLGLEARVRVSMYERREVAAVELRVGDMVYTQCIKHLERLLDLSVYKCTSAKVRTLRLLQLPDTNSYKLHLPQLSHHTASPSQTMLCSYVHSYAATTPNRPILRSLEIPCLC